MAFVQPGDGTLDYFPCHYGTSRLTFRGPQRDLTREYLVSLGGTETYGRFVISPYPALVEEVLGIPMANLACQNAGPDVYLSDRAVLDVAAEGHLAVVQLTGAQNLTNRYYTVHPRRNDRFIAATPLLRQLYREVDFTEIHFTRHLIKALASRGPDRFGPIVAEVQALWLQRMKAVLNRLPPRRILLWMADCPPPAAGEIAEGAFAPWLVDQAMIKALMPSATAYVEHIVSPAALKEGVQSMRFSPADEVAAQELPNAAAHQEAADALMPVIERLL
jgi:Domain of unknown function (DUF6473)